jgi:hypothetical protein
MSDLEAVPREEVGREEWDQFVDRSPDAWLWHRFDLCDALGKWEHSADASFAVREDRRLIAVMPLRVISYRRLRILDRCDVESLGGPAVAADAGRRLALRAREAAVRLASVRASAPVSQLRVALPPLAPALRGDSAPAVNPLLALGLENALTQTWMVDLRVGREGLWQGLEGRARTAIRKAQREGVTLRDALPGQEDLDTYFALHLATCARTGAPPHPRRYFESIWRHFLPQRLARILFAQRNGRVIAARNFAVYKGGVGIWTAAGLDEAGSLGANALLQWEAMRTFADEGVEWSDNGEGFPGASDPKLRGLSQFKQSFGGDLVPFYRGRMDFRSRSLRVLDAVRN